ncbi:MAG: 50S ribosomal protein L7ae [Clostridiales bacterium]|nr:MAG: 50S ribosomal protein L7ae [Clostridiales bacterium]
MNSNKIKALLGFCQKSGNLKSGTENVVKSIITNKAKLIFLATDTAINTRKKINDKANFYGVDIISIFTVDEISNIVGKNNRVAVAIIDKGFAASIKKILADNEEVSINAKS